MTAALRFAVVVLAAAWGPAQAAIAFKPEQAEGPDASTWGVAIVVVLAVLSVMLLLLRRYGPAWARLPSTWPAVSAAVRVTGSVRLNPQVQLTVVEFDRQRLLLAVTTTSATVLERAPLDHAEGVTP